MLASENLCCVRELERCGLVLCDIRLWGDVASGCFSGELIVGLAGTHFKVALGTFRLQYCSHCQVRFCVRTT